MIVWQRVTALDARNISAASRTDIRRGLRLPLHEKLKAVLFHFAESQPFKQAQRRIEALHINGHPLFRLLGFAEKLAHDMRPDARIAAGGKNGDVQDVQNLRPPGQIEPASPGSLLLNKALVFFTTPPRLLPTPPPHSPPHQ